MYPFLAESIHSRRRALVKYSPKGLYAWDVFRMATSGEYIPIDTAIAIRNLYFPGDSLEELFQRCDDSTVLTVAEAGHIMQHTVPGDVMPEMQDAVFEHIKNTVVGSFGGRGATYAMGWCLAIGRAAGVREERARKRVTGGDAT